MNRCGSGWHGESRRHRLASCGVKTVVPEFKAEGSRVKVDWDRGFLNENEIQVMKNRLNKGDRETEEILEKVRASVGGLMISPDQSSKGFRWLYNKYKTSKGSLRKGNPFNANEALVLDNFDYFKLVDFYDFANPSQIMMGVHSYLPVYKVVSKPLGDGRRRTFTYSGFQDFFFIHSRGEPYERRWM